MSGQADEAVSGEQGVDGWWWAAVVVEVLLAVAPVDEQVLAQHEVYVVQQVAEGGGEVWEVVEGVHDPQDLGRRRAGQAVRFVYLPVVVVVGCAPGEEVGRR